MVSPVPDVPKPTGGRRTSKKLALKIELHAESLKPLPATDSQTKSHAMNIAPMTPVTNTSNNLKRLQDSAGKQH